MAHRIRTDEITLTDQGLLIKKVSVIDSDTGEVHHVVKLNDELVKLFKSIEIDISLFYKIKKNPDLMNLIQTFNLVT